MQPHRFAEALSGKAPLARASIVKVLSASRRHTNEQQNACCFSGLAESNALGSHGPAFGWPATVRADPRPVPVAIRRSLQETRPGKAAVRSGMRSSPKRRRHVPAERHFHSVHEGQKAETPVYLLTKELSASTDLSQRTDCPPATRFARAPWHGRKTALR